MLAKPGMLPEPMRDAVRLDGSEPRPTKSTCGLRSRPPRRCRSGAMLAPSRRLKPMPPPVPPPPPGRPRMSTPSTAVGGTVGSNIDQPAVWQRAQLHSNSSWPSLTFAPSLPLHRPGDASAVGRLVSRRGRRRTRSPASSRVDLGGSSGPSSSRLARLELGVRGARHLRACLAALRFASSVFVSASSFFWASTAAMPGTTCTPGRRLGSVDRAAFKCCAACACDSSGVSWIVDEGDEVVDRLGVLRAAAGDAPRLHRCAGPAVGDDVVISQTAAGSRRARLVGTRDLR